MQKYKLIRFKGLLSRTIFMDLEYQKYKLNYFYTCMYIISLL